MNVEAARSGRVAPIAMGVRIAIGILVLFSILAMPVDLASIRQLPFALTPAEAFCIVAFIAILPRSAGRWMLRVVMLLAGLMLFVKLADLGTRAAFARDFNPVLDLHLLRSGWHLLSGSVGRVGAIGAIAITSAAFAGVLCLLGWGLGGIVHLRRNGRIALGAPALAAAILVAVFAADPAPAARLVAERTQSTAQSLREFAAFDALIGEDPLRNIEAGSLLSGLAGRDVVLAFVESYGRSAVEDAPYAEEVRARLAAVEDGIGRAGFSARSGWLTAPTVGGQSWLSHATLLSGLWVDGQRRYERLVASRRASLNALFRQAGWRSAALMPAITMAWPEGDWYGYDAIHARDDLGYRGEPFNWVTMPDQYTLAALQRLELGTVRSRPLMAELALISSHAPWTPIPPLLPWGDVGNGTIFTPYASAGDPPEVVWRDPERVRQQYALSIDYALETLGSFVETYGGDDQLFIILGDHQPAPIITGESASRDVPIHILSRDRELLERLDEWGWTRGMVPSRGAPVWRMDAFRERFVRAFSDGAGS
ncbi:sulfatase [Aureimonas mangrovi]|uniref:sulfatase n=1 Tax=Aureimonas mangrovi TaxID=2758041 RepID=UPI00163DA8B7|nr:sulfatase [Aureimonas mangrovi]